MQVAKRKLVNKIAIGICGLTAVIGTFWFLFIIITVFINGISALNFDLLLEEAVPPGQAGGGLKHAFVGQALITLVAIVVGIPLGMMGGTFLAEYGRGSKLAKFLSSLSDIMISIPSIVVGTFVYTLMVEPVGHFNGWAGSIALAIIMIPIIIRTTEDMMKIVPMELREAAFALGAPYYKVIWSVVYKSAASGILTGVLMAIARIAGETAPLLFTSFNNNFFSLNMNESMPSLTVTIYQYAMGPYDVWHSQAWAASFLITFAILIVTLSSKLMLKRGAVKSNE
ncbi:MAG: phosphate ABC transporter permease PstA [Calditrichaeota bacterium]|nr:phosphate ABC transporter permease PstA [Calditrichota bacterium]